MDRVSCKTLQDQDVDIIAIDDHEDVINQYESMITTGCWNYNRPLDAAEICGNCDTVVIATGKLGISPGGHAL